MKFFRGETFVLVIFCCGLRFGQIWANTFKLLILKGCAHETQKACIWEHSSHCISHFLFNSLASAGRSSNFLKLLKMSEPRQVPAYEYGFVYIYAHTHIFLLCMVQMWLFLSKEDVWEMKLWDCFRIRITSPLGTRPAFAPGLHTGCVLGKRAASTDKGESADCEIRWQIQATSILCINLRLKRFLPTKHSYVSFLVG